MPFFLGCRCCAAMHVTSRKLTPDLAVTWDVDWYQGLLTFDPPRTTTGISNPDSAGNVWVTGASGEVVGKWAKEFDSSGATTARFIIAQVTLPGVGSGSGGPGRRIKIDSVDRIVLESFPSNIGGAVLVEYNQALTELWAKRTQGGFELTADDDIVIGEFVEPRQWFKLRVSDGAVIWRTSIGDPELLTDVTATIDVAFDSAGNVLVLGVRNVFLPDIPIVVARSFVMKLTPDGQATTWSVDNPLSTIMPLQAIANDSDDNVYVCGNERDNDFDPQQVTLGKFNEDGNLIATWKSGGTLRAIAIDEDDNVYVVGDRVTATDTAAVASLWKLDTDLNVLASFDHGDTLRDVQVGNDAVYVTGERVPV